MDSKPSGNLRVYADASYKDGRIGLGLAIYAGQELVELVASSEYGNSSFQAEAAAIKLAIEVTSRKYPGQKFQVLSDCQGCVDLCMSDDEHFNRRIEKLADQRAAFAVMRIRIELLSNPRIHLQWIRGHNRNAGNDYADLAANKGRSVKGTVSLYHSREGRTPPPNKKNSAFNYAAFA